MLYSLSNNDPVKYQALKDIKESIVSNSYYLKTVETLNNLLITIRDLKELKKNGNK